MVARLRWLVAVSLGMVLLESAAGGAAPALTGHLGAITPGSKPHGIAAGPDGNLWFTDSGFTEVGRDRVAKITPAGVVSEYRITPAGAPPDAAPEGWVAGPDGDLGFTELAAGRVAKITPAGVVTEYSAGITANSSPLNIVAGPDGNLWFTELRGDRVAKITPAGVVTE